MTSSRVVIFASGVVPDRERARALLRSTDIIVCADGGARHARSLGLTPEAVIGDLDSLGAQEQTALAAGTIALQAHPRDKDETDLELALQYALDRHPAAILIVGALGGRLDHTLGNISLLSDSRFAGLECGLDDGTEEVFFCRGDCTVHGQSDDLVSLLPWNGPCAGIRSDGLRWPLRGETLYPGRSRGISNEMLGDLAHLSMESGLLLIVHRRQH